MPLEFGKKEKDGKAPASIPTVEREPDAIYQWDSRHGERLVARVADVEVDEAGKEVRFGEIFKSDDLLLPEECEYQKFILVVRKIAYATKAAKESPQKGRILRGVVAEIVGYREN